MRGKDDTFSRFARIVEFHYIEFNRESFIVNKNSNRKLNNKRKRQNFAATIRSIRLGFSMVIFAITKYECSYEHKSKFTNVSIYRDIFGKKKKKHFFKIEI